MFEKYLNIDAVHEIRSRAFIYFGFGAIEKMNAIAEDFKSKGIDKVLVVASGTAYKKSGAWEPTEKALSKAGIAYLLFDQVKPNPDTDTIDSAVAQAREFGAKSVIGIGGGSPIDTAKSIAILLANSGYSAKDLYEWKFLPVKALPIVAINLTHGTGTEGNRMAVATINSTQYKPSIAFECIYPTWSIDDPNLMISLPPKQILYTTIDAMNHVIESATTTVTNMFAVTLAREALALCAQYLPIAMADPTDKIARFHLAYAALIAGISFDNGSLHYTHALGHTLSGMRPEVIHGQALAVLLPAILENIYPACPDVLADILSPVVPGLKPVASDAAKAARGVEEWLFKMGSDQKMAELGFTEADIETLTELVFTTPSLGALLAVTPTKATKETVSEMFKKSMKRLD